MTTMTTPRSNKLVAALKSRFASPEAVLLRLGLDAGLLAPTASGGNSDPVKKMRIAIEDLFGKLDLDEKQIKRVLEVLDEHSDPRKLDDSDPYAERARSIVGEDEVEEENLLALKEFLTSKGISLADADKAIGILAGPTAEDRLPVSGPSGLGGYRSGRERMPGESVFASDERRRAVAMDAGRRARVEADFNKRFPDAARIGVGFDYTPTPPAAAPTEAARERFAKFYPGSQLIGGG